MDRRFAVAAVVAAASVGCQAGLWGPMAVTDEDATVVVAAGGFPGTLRIGDRCVTMAIDEIDREITLVWRSGQAAWLPMTQQILFEDVRAGQLRLSDGDRIAPGGSGIAEPDDPDQGAPQPRWLSPPDASCPAELFAVHSIRRLPD